MQRLTLAGLEIAAVHQIGDRRHPTTLVVGQVRAVLPHPDAGDRLVLVDVDHGGEEPQRVVTGAPQPLMRTGCCLADAQGGLCP